MKGRVFSFNTGTAHVWGQFNSLSKYPRMSHAKDAKDAKFSGEISLCVLCGLCVRLFQQAVKVICHSAFSV